MYSPASFNLKPSRFLLLCQYGLHGLLAIVCLSTSFKFYVYLAPIFIAQGLHISKLRKRKFLFLQFRQWRFQDNNCFLTAPNKEPVEVPVILHQLWPSIIIFSFKLNGMKYWEVVYKDALIMEHFRQLKAIFKLRQLTLQTVEGKY